MPNYIANVLRFTGEQTEINKLVEAFSTFFPSKPSTSHDGQLVYEDPTQKYTYGWLNEKTGEFSVRGEKGLTVLEGGIPEGWVQNFEKEFTRFPDFDKVVPMPPTLHVEVHSGIESAVEYALRLIEKDDDTPEGIRSLINSMKAANAKKSKSALEFNDDEWEIFITCLNNVRKYGHMYWYSWAIENWGTKWNACSCEKNSDTEFYFETAWSPVPNLIQMMAAQFPLVGINYEWSDEDTGSNCGYANYSNGEAVEVVEYENGSNEAYEMAFKLRPDRKENYKMVGGKYQYNEE
jgi:hypothetical protein